MMEKGIDYYDNNMDFSYTHDNEKVKKDLSHIDNDLQLIIDKLSDNVCELCGFKDFGISSSLTYYRNFKSYLCNKCVDTFCFDCYSFTLKNSTCSSCYYIHHNLCEKCIDRKATEYNVDLNSQMCNVCMDTTYCFDCKTFSINFSDICIYCNK